MSVNDDFLALDDLATQIRAAWLPQAWRYHPAC
jgi:hypothetical protein